MVTTRESLCLGISLKKWRFNNSVGYIIISNGRLEFRFHFRHMVQDNVHFHHVQDNIALWMLIYNYYQYQNDRT
ncbi:hypothetical protein DERP_001641 [Dermatophagoides pteronyssinus]|uniref:Uncharacterized protein n=1 Tax=Dermatophagoides pteronyssinus TaxID=6956 RepID=A0ABQ8JB34_DERPT|nr:hypothetical protein DERP_001641 [Dermatophagoides pteronyssinus]